MFCAQTRRSCRLRIAAVAGFLAAVAATAGPTGLLSWPAVVLAAYLLVTGVVLVAMRRTAATPRPGNRHGWR